MSDGNGENNPNGDGFNHRGKGFVKVKYIPLMETFSNKSSLELVDCLSGFSLTLKTHLQPIACLCAGRGTKVQVLF